MEFYDMSSFPVIFHCSAPEKGKMQYEKNPLLFYDTIKSCSKEWVSNGQVYYARCNKRFAE